MRQAVIKAFQVFARVCYVVAKEVGTIADSDLGKKTPGFCTWKLFRARTSDEKGGMTLSF